MSNSRSFNPWMWLPVMVIGVAAVSNLALILVARRTHVTKVEEHPWLAAERIDRDKVELQAFAARGLRFAVEGHGLHVTCRLAGPAGAPAPSPLRLHCYRASDAGLDRTVDWTDPQQPLEMELPVAGRWELRLLHDGAVVMTHALSLSP